MHQVIVVPVEVILAEKSTQGGRSRGRGSSTSLVLCNVLKRRSKCRRVVVLSQLTWAEEGRGERDYVSACVRVPYLLCVSG